MIEFKNVFLKYVEEFFSLHNFSHTFNNNTVIIGDKLSGADTVLRLIAKLDKSYEGDIFIDGTNIKNLNDRNLNIAFVSDEPYLFKLRSLEYNLSYPLKIRGYNKEYIIKDVNELKTKFNLNEFKNIKKLTIGEKKIITLLRALIRKPKYVLLEYFFEDLPISCIPLATEIINEICKNSIILACENKLPECLKSAEIINMDN